MHGLGDAGTNGGNGGKGGNGATGAAWGGTGATGFNGAAGGAGGAGGNGSGGGLYVSGGTVILTSDQFENNQAGGGVGGTRRHRPSGIRRRYRRWRRLWRKRGAGGGGGEGELNNSGKTGSGGDGATGGNGGTGGVGGKGGKGGNGGAGGKGGNGGNGMGGAIYIGGGNALPYHLDARRQRGRRWSRRSRKTREPRGVAGDWEGSAELVGRVLAVAARWQARISNGRIRRQACNWGQGWGRWCRWCGQDTAEPVAQVELARAGGDGDGGAMAMNGKTTVSP